MSATVDLHTTSTELHRAEAEARQIDRMAELVVELTGCDPTGAQHVVRDLDRYDHEDRFALLARAMVAVKQPSPLREPVYVDAG